MLSLIVTIYNTPIPDLQRCFSSIQNETYSDFEVILVDDGSKDEIAAFLDEMVQKDQRFQVYHVPNGGVSHARNLGMNYAMGEYIAFCDSDDELMPNFMQQGLEYIKTYDLDMISGGVLLKDYQRETPYACTKAENDIWIYTDMTEILDYALTNYAKDQNHELKNILIARVYPKIYKAELAKSVRFPEDIRMSEYNLYFFYFFKKLKRLGITDAIWYIYHQNEYSLTHHNDGLIQNRQKEQYDFAMQVLAEREKTQTYLKNAYDIRLFHIFINYFNTMILSLHNWRALYSTWNSSWGKSVRQANFDAYYNISMTDIKYRRIFRSTPRLFTYFFYRRIRSLFGRCVRKILR